jgi:hypothetical protein
MGVSAHEYSLCWLPEKKRHSTKCVSVSASENRGDLHGFQVDLHEIYVDLHGIEAIYTNFGVNIQKWTTQAAKPLCTAEFDTVLYSSTLSASAERKSWRFNTYYNIS